jgi:hypothetical protein
MKTHIDIDRRSLAMARVIAKKIDADPMHRGLEQARSVCGNWCRQNPSDSVLQWQRILDGSWEEVRQILLDESQEGQRLRQNSPFCGILNPRERWRIYRDFTA